MINAKTGQWLILTRIKYIRPRTDNVPAGLRRVFLLETTPSLLQHTDQSELVHVRD